MAASRIEPFPFRLGGFGTIVADPAWRYDDQGGRMNTGTYDGTLSNEEILALPVDTISGEKSHLYLWTTDAHLEVALACMRRWSYTFKRTFVWVKTTIDGEGLKMGGGHYLRGAHELCLFGVRDQTGIVRDVPTVFFAPHPRNAEGKIIHSAKPPNVHEIAERISPAPRLELFAREPRDGWTGWGNQLRAA